jgi:hypothetical protein
MSRLGLLPTRWATHGSKRHEDAGRSRGVVLGYAAPAEHDYRATLAALRAALR